MIQHETLYVAEWPESSAVPFPIYNQALFYFSHNYVVPMTGDNLSVDDDVTGDIWLSVLHKPLQTLYENFRYNNWSVMSDCLIHSACLHCEDRMYNTQAHLSWSATTLGWNIARYCLLHIQLIHVHMAITCWHLTNGFFHVILLLILFIHAVTQFQVKCYT